MKKVYLFTITFLLVAGRLTAQKQDHPVFHFTGSGQQDTLLAGWVFHAGDDLQWARPELNDEGWQAVDPGMDITGFDLLKKAGIGWLRLHIRTDSAIGDLTLAAWVNQFTASEIYLDGKLIKRYGIVRMGNSTATSPGHELFTLPMRPGTEQVIAVRLSPQSKLPYIQPNFMPLPSFAMYINGYPAASVNYVLYDAEMKRLLILYTAILGIFIFITLIHLIYYIYYRQQKVHLYYFIYGFFVSVMSGLSIPFFTNIDDVALQISADITVCICAVISGIFAVLVIYEIFDYRRRIFLKILAFIGVLFLGWLYKGGGTGFFMCAYLFPVLGMAEGLRVGIWARQHKKRDAILFSPFMLLCIGLNLWYWTTDFTSSFSQLLSGVSYLCFPVGMAIYLGVQNAVQNRRLAKTLEEVRLLSEQKQQILADQNTVLEQQVTERTAALNQSLAELKQTQTQLIQAEKMASLGELTAGIAHEIQNPLNFVNNFSEVSVELAAEIEEAVRQDDKEEAVALAADIRENLQKITHHGKRADAIVKGMLQHSRTGTGKKEPTDINALADEYLRLSYHGLRARDKSFNAVPMAIGIKTDFDESIGKIEIVPQDMGRVLLNLFNNAFYAVMQKKKVMNEGSYEPSVTVSTKKLDGKVVITIRDNGTGISQKVLDKIYQPFFTTKPTGEGTGLGLSLSYDIVTKGHGGELRVKSRENEFTEFIISLPL
jgi:two-component system, NtrC family, sensor kinase